MCGICGVMALDGPLDPCAAGGRARDECGHRAPRSRWRRLPRRRAATLGHRRLAIIDRAGGAQPMANEDGTCWIVFNGEVYNHHRIRPVLEAHGHRFRTASDTEAILHAWEQYGPSCVDHLEGMFAFAIYDARKHELFVARDRLGKKPLFYGTFGGALHFASELRALAPAPRGAVTSICRPSRATSRSATSSPRTRRTETFGSSSRAAGSTSPTGESRRRATGTSRSSAPTRATTRRSSPMSTRRSARRCTSGSKAKCRSGPFSARRHRLGAGRVVHGRGARRSARHGDRSASPRRRTTSSRRLPSRRRTSARGTMPK